MKLSAAHQPLRDVGRLQQRALGRKVGRQISCDGDKDMPALVGVAPVVKLSYARLEHLVGMEARILPEQHLSKCRDQCLRRVAQRKVTGDKARCGTDLLLAVEGVEKSSADLLGRDGQVIEPLAAFAGQRGWGHI